MSKDDDKFSATEVPSLKTIQCITSRERFTSPLDFFDDGNGRSFGSIVAPYHLSGEMIKCGIKTCRTPHWHGYIITTSDNLETNIGKDCGKKHFKADFTAEMKRHDALYERKLKIERIISLKKEAPAMLRQLTDLQSQYMKLKSMRFKLRGRLSANDNQRLDIKAKSGDRLLYRYEARTSEERAAYLEANPSARKTGIPPKQIPVGEIDGFEFLCAQHSDEEIFNFINPLRQVCNSSQNNIATWTQASINSTHAWIGRSKTMLPAAMKLVSHGHEFFTEKNITQLSLIEIDQAALRSFINDLQLK